MAVERELKFSMDARAAQQLADHPILLLLGGAPRVQQLSTVYFDTPDARLAAAGLALRVRQTPQGRVLTVKSTGTDALGHARGEWEWPAEDGAPQGIHPADLVRALDQTPLRTLGLDAGALQSSLRPAFGTAFARTAWTLDWAGARAELALDRGACTAIRDGRAVQAPLLELEIELIEGDFDACWELAWALAQDLPLLVSPVNKAERAAALAGGDRPQAPPETPRLDGETPLGRAAQLWLSTACAQLAVWAERIGSADEARDVHQFRVVLRRLRTVLRWLRPHASARTVAWFAAELHWTMQLAGLVRDADVALDMLHHRPAPLGGEGAAESPAWLEALRHERMRHRAALLAHLHSPRFGRLLLALARWAQAWGGRAGRAGPVKLRRLASLAVRHDHKRWNKALAHGREMMDAAARGAPLDPASAVALHDLRIRSKRLRLSLERLGQALPQDEAPRVLPLRKTVEALQTHLGAWHDVQRLLDPANALFHPPADVAAALRALGREALRRALQELRT